MRTLLIILFISPTFALAKSEWLFEVGVGKSQVNTTGQASQLYFEQGLFDSVIEKNKDDKTNWLLSVKKSYSKFDSTQLWLGASFYAQKASYSGQVMGLGLPQFTNFAYTRHLTAYSGLLEAEIRLSPLFERITPMALIGIGLGHTQWQYDETAIGFYPVRDEIHKTNNHFNLALDAGIGVAVELFQNLQATVKYLYLNNDYASNNLWLSLNYKMED